MKQLWSFTEWHDHRMDGFSVFGSSYSAIDTGNIVGRVKSWFRVFWGQQEGLMSSGNNWNNCGNTAMGEERSRNCYLQAPLSPNLLQSTPAVYVFGMRDATEWWRSLCPKYSSSNLPAWSHIISVYPAQREVVSWPVKQQKWRHVAAPSRNNQAWVPSSLVGWKGLHSGLDP